MVMDISELRYRTGRELDDYETTPSLKVTKENALERLEENKVQMAVLQDKLYAEGKAGLLLILQGMDTSGKDSAIKHVLSGMNPQGIEVTSFKSPNVTELEHDYMWRTDRVLPPKGKVGVFNRSYYEDVLVVRVHGLVPGHGMEDRDFWKMRYRQIRNKEDYLLENHIVPVKVFLHISKKEQAQRLLRRIDDSKKNWKFDVSDIRERAYWEDYQKAYQEMFEDTSSKKAPWYIIPADKKWYARLLLSEILVKELENLKPKYPQVTQQQRETLEQYRSLLEKEIQ